MKTNHRDGTVKRLDHGANWNPINAKLKHWSHRKMRAAERKLLSKPSPDINIIPTRLTEVCDGWFYD